MAATCDQRWPDSRRGVTLLELLTVVAIIGLLVAILVPSLSGARREAQLATCGAHLRELGRALQLYGNDHDGRLMPLAAWSFEEIGEGPVVYWWGADAPTSVEAERGFLHCYLQSPLGDRSVFECPDQPWGSYEPQGLSQSPTSTYGYNGYYLSPSHAPGWAFTIGNRPWQDFARVQDPARVLAFADTAIDLGGDRPRNDALLDPPMLYQGSGVWTAHDNPTTSFRHTGRTQAVHVDGHVERYVARRESLTSTRFAIGSIGLENGPYYVPDWRSWP